LPTSLSEDKHRDVGGDGYTQDIPSAWEQMEAQLDPTTIKPSSSATPMAGTLSRRYLAHLSPWLEKMKWAKCLADQSLEAVAELLAPLKLEEVGLQSLI
jgi:hypothetical protein